MNSRYAPFLLGCVLTLSACGAGGSSASSGSPVSPPPSVGDQPAGPVEADPPVAPPDSTHTPAPPLDAAKLTQALDALDRSGFAPASDRSTTIAGEDQDRDGIRDDVQKFILALPDTAEQKKALRQLSRSIDDAMLLGIAASDDESIEAASLSLSLAVRCLSISYAEGSLERLKQMESQMTNTRARFEAYDSFNRKLDGTVDVMSNENTCDAR